MPLTALMWINTFSARRYGGDQVPQFAANFMFLFQEMPLWERFEAAREAGFRHVEYQFPYAEDKTRFSGYLQDFDLSMVLINAPAGNREVGDRGIAALPDRVEEFKAGFMDALEWATALECPLLHIMSGVVEQGGEDYATAQYVENLNFAASLAEPLGITVLIEPINGQDVPGYLVQRTGQARAILAMIDAPNVALQYDAYHALMNDEDPVEGLRANFDVIRHMQVAGYPGRHEPGSGTYDFNLFFEACDMIGYGGAIGCEYVPEVSTDAGLEWAFRYGINPPMPAENQP